MSPNLVRGNNVKIVYIPKIGVAQRMYRDISCTQDDMPKLGDELTISKRKLGGWYRVKNSRTGLVTTIRNGPWLMKMDNSNQLVKIMHPHSPINQHISVSQVERLEATIVELEKTLFQSIKDHYEDVDRLNKQLAVLQKKHNATEELREFDSRLRLRTVDEMNEVKNEVATLKNQLTELEEHVNTQKQLIEFMDNDRRIEKEIRVKLENELEDYRDTYKSSQQHLPELLDRDKKLCEKSCGFSMCGVGGPYIKDYESSTDAYVMY
mgnify:CR=1 FL=1